MKKYLVSVLGLSTLVLFGASSLTVNAAEEASSEAKTQGTMTFKIDDSPVTPDNPNVNRPDIPSETIPEDSVKPGTPEDPGPGSGGSGTKAFYINFAPNLVFKDIEITGTNMTKISDPITFKGIERDGKAVQYAPFVQVTDNRGTANGWDLTLQSTEFKASSDSEELKGVTFDFKPGVQSNVIKPVNGQELYNMGPEALPKGSLFQVGSSNQFQLLSAESGKGVGSWIYTFGGTNCYDVGDMQSCDAGDFGNFDIYSGLYNEGTGVEVMVPASSLPKINKTYVSDLTWTLMSSPTS